MKLITMLTILTAAGAFSACASESADDQTPTANEASAATTDAGAGMDNMAIAGEAKSGSGTGNVTAIDKAAGKITLDHGPIPAVGWPAMKMTFDAKPEVINAVGVGDKVSFDVAVKGTSGEVTKIQRSR